jgi:glycerol-3-phosphate acyltransferase PlsX
MNPDTYGAAPLLGVDGPAWICHGGSSPYAIKNALRLASRSIDEGLVGALAESLTRNAELSAAAKANGGKEEPKPE